MFLKQNIWYEVCMNGMWHGCTQYIWMHAHAIFHATYMFLKQNMSLKLHIYLLERTLRWIEVRARQLSAGHTIAHPVRSCLVLEHRKLEYVVQQHACKMHLWMSEKKCVWGKNHTQRGKLSRIMGGGMRLMGRQRKKGRGIAPAHFLGALGNMSPGTKINQKHK